MPLLYVYGKIRSSYTRWYRSSYAYTKGYIHTSARKKLLPNVRGSGTGYVQEQTYTVELLYIQVLEPSLLYRLLPVFGMQLLLTYLLIL